MDDEKLERLENFVRIYCFEAARVLDGRTMRLDRFQEELYGKISDLTGLSREMVGKIDHPFHWVLFNNGHFGFRLGVDDEEETIIEKETASGGVDEDRLYSLVWESETYRELLEAKWDAQVLGNQRGKNYDCRNGWSDWIRATS